MVDIVPIKWYTLSKEVIFMFMTVKQAAEKWGISDRRVRVLCAEEKIPGAFQVGRGWKIPIDAVKPADGRFKTANSLLALPS